MINQGSKAAHQFIMDEVDTKASYTYVNNTVDAAIVAEVINRDNAIDVKISDHDNSNVSHMYIQNLVATVQGNLNVHETSLTAHADIRGQFLNYATHYEVTKAIEDEIIRADQKYVHKTNPSGLFTITAEKTGTIPGTDTWTLRGDEYGHLWWGTIDLVHSLSYMTIDTVQTVTATKYYTKASERQSLTLTRGEITRINQENLDYGFVDKDGVRVGEIVTTYNAGGGSSIGFVGYRDSTTENKDTVKLTITTSGSANLNGPGYYGNYGNYINNTDVASRTTIGIVTTTSQEFSGIKSFTHEIRRVNRGAKRGETRTSNTEALISYVDKSGDYLGDLRNVLTLDNDAYMILDVYKDQNISAKSSFLITYPNIGTPYMMGPSIKNGTASKVLTELDAMWVPHYEFADIPAPVASREGEIFQYIGATTSENPPIWVNAYFYKCVEITPVTVPKTYKWIRTDVQPKEEGVKTVYLGDDYHLHLISPTDGVPADGEVCQMLIEGKTPILRSEQNEAQYLAYFKKTATDAEACWAYSILWDTDELVYNVFKWHLDFVSPTSATMELQSMKTLRQDTLEYMTETNRIHVMNTDDSADYMAGEIYYYDSTGGSTVITNISGALKVMPTPNGNYNNGRIYQYMGATAGDYKHGHFYECKLIQPYPAVYEWQEVLVQEQPKGKIIYLGPDNHFHLTSCTDGVPADDKVYQMIMNKEKLILEDMQGNNLYLLTVSDDLPLEIIVGFSNTSTGITNVIRTVEATWSGSATTSSTGAVIEDYVNASIYAGAPEYYSNKYDSLFVATNNSTNYFMGETYFYKTNAAAGEKIINMTGALKTMPTPRNDYRNGKIYQYMGDTTTTAPIYKYGHFYECKLVSGSYEWVHVQSVSDAVPQLKEFPVATLTSIESFQYIGTPSTGKLFGEHYVRETVFKITYNGATCYVVSAPGVADPRLVYSDEHLSEAIPNVRCYKGTGSEYYVKNELTGAMEIITTFSSKLVYMVKYKKLNALEIEEGKKTEREVITAKDFSEGVFERLVKEIGLRKNGKQYAVNDRAIYPGGSGYLLKCTQSGTADTTLPSLPASIVSGKTILSDNSVRWVIYDLTQNEFVPQLTAFPYAVFSGHESFQYIGEETDGKKTGEIYVKKINLKCTYNGTFTAYLNKYPRINEPANAYSDIFLDNIETDLIACTDDNTTYYIKSKSDPTEIYPCTITTVLAYVPHYKRLSYIDIEEGTETISKVTTAYDISKGINAGITNIISYRKNSTAYVVNDVVRLRTFPGYFLVCKTAGTTDISFPYFPEPVSGKEFVDGTVVWTVYTALDKYIPIRETLPDPASNASPEIISANGITGYTNGETLYKTSAYKVRGEGTELYYIKTLPTYGGEGLQLYFDLALRKKAVGYTLTKQGDTGDLYKINKPDSTMYLTQVDETDLTYSYEKTYDNNTDIMAILDILYPIGSYAFGQHPLYGTWTEVTGDRAVWIKSGVSDGTTIAQELPNIYGCCYFPVNSSGSDIIIQTSGAISTNTANAKQPCMSTGSTGYGSAFYFNAKDYNSIYKNNANVQPNAYVMKVWKRTA